MTTTFSSALKVGFAVAEEANACVALSATKWALIIRIRNWAEHWSMLMFATASESCSTIVFIVKNDIPKAQVDLQVDLLDARVSSLLKGMLHFLRIDLM